MRDISVERRVAFAEVELALTKLEMSYYQGNCVTDQVYFKNRKKIDEIRKIISDMDMGFIEKRYEVYLQEDN